MNQKLSKVSDLLSKADALTVKAHEILEKENRKDTYSHDDYLTLGQLQDQGLELEEIAKAFTNEIWVYRNEIKHAEEQEYGA